MCRENGLQMHIDSPAAFPGDLPCNYGYMWMCTDTQTPLRETWNTAADRGAISHIQRQTHSLNHSLSLLLRPLTHTQTHTNSCRKSTWWLEYKKRKTNQEEMNVIQKLANLTQTKTPLSEHVRLLNEAWKWAHTGVGDWWRQKGLLSFKAVEISEGGGAAAGNPDRTGLFSLWGFIR